MWESLIFLVNGLLIIAFPVLSSTGTNGRTSLLSLSLDDMSKERVEWTSGAGTFGGPGPGLIFDEDSRKPLDLDPEDSSSHHQAHHNPEKGLSLKQSLSLVHFSNKSITCNDGTPAGYYIRKSPYKSSKTWIIFLEGGWYCFNEKSCQNRWMRLKNLMTSSGWSQFRHIRGILSSDSRENPYWWNANHVFLPYCSSDTWSGTVSGKDSGTPFSFMGALIVDEVMRDLVSFGGLQSDSTVILAGSSAGGTGVMLNLDRVDLILKNAFGDSPNPRVRGIADSGWFIDKVPTFVENGNCNDVLLCPPEISLQKGMELWKTRLPQNCQDAYPGETWSCFFGYKIYPTLRAPLFVFQWLFDEAQMLVNNVPTPALRKEEWDTVYKVGDELKKSLVNVTSVMTPACISHTVLTNRDWRHVEVNSVHLPRALKCWESGGVIEESNYIPSSRSSQFEWEEESSLRINGRPGLHSRNRPRLSSSEIEDDSDSELNIFIESNDSSRRHHRRHGRHRKNKKRRRRRKRLEEQRQRQLKTAALSQQQGNIPMPIEKRQPQLQAHNKNKTKNPNNPNTRRKKHTRHQSGNNGTPALNINSRSQSERDNNRLQRRRNRQRRWFSLCEGGASGIGDMRLIEKCSWPQCNKSCPKLLNPLTGEEVDFKDLLKSFGLDMATMARALGIDLATLDSMDHQVLLQMLTQHA